MIEERWNVSKRVEGREKTLLDSKKDYIKEKKTGKHVVCFVAKSLKF